jgi:catechol 2,3-dioxygenase-like lactoylglutathione lyase family enzyme
MKVTRFHHVSVNTHGTPLEPLADFYREVLGLGDAPRPDIHGIPGVWHTVGDQQLHLVGSPPSGDPIDSRGNHYCVSVTDIDEAIRELEARGIEYKRGVQGEGIVQIWIADPAGNTIELQQETRTQ